MTQNEKDTFLSEYDGVASSLVSSLFLDLRLNFWMARLLASTITLTMEATGQPATNLTISAPRWDAITQEARIVGSASIVSWIPFLYNDAERQAFEDRVRQTELHEEALVHPPCYLCDGDPNQVFQNTDDEVEVLGFGTFTCEQMYYGAKSGAIPPETCPVLRTYTDPICNCIQTLDAESSIDVSETSTVNQTSSSQIDNIVPWSVDQGLFRLVKNEGGVVAISQELESAPYAPMYSVSRTARSLVLYNQFSDPHRANALGTLIFGHTPILSEMRLRTDAYDQYAFSSSRSTDSASDLYFPVFDADPINPQLVGAVAMELRWTNILSAEISQHADLLTIVIGNSCDQVYTYRIDPVQGSLSFQGIGDLHNAKYDSWVRSTTYESYQQLIGVVSNGIPISNATETAQCLYRFEVYPTQALEDTYITNEPVLYAVASALIFLFSALVFFVYDMIVRRRQKKSWPLPNAPTKLSHHYSLTMFVSECTTMLLLLT
jgi:hypothetical protein